jgi:tRNA(Arg) A34 adenosine deaminase TadA
MTNPFIEKAIELAVENVRTCGGGPFGAVIARDGAMVAAGVNRVTASNDPTAHAEVVAIRNAAAALGTFDLTGCEIWASCEPCPMCLGAIYWARIGRVWYAADSEDAQAAGFDDRHIYQEFAKPNAEREIPMVQVAHAGRLRAFEAWSRSGARVEY